LGDPGFVVGKGFLVSDGTFVYQVADGGIVASNGETDPLFAVATTSGSWAVPAGTVTKLETSVPSTVTLAVANKETGIPGTGAETLESYRSRVLEANLAASQGMARYLRTLLKEVSGVQSRLVRPLIQPGGNWMTIVGGGDPKEVAYAIYYALFDISNIVGSTLDVSTITNALPGVVTTFLNHGEPAGQDIVIAGVTPSGFNGNFVVYSVLSEKTFQLGKRFLLNTIVAATWSGSVVTFTTTTPHGVTVGSTYVIAGMTPSGYNGTFVATSGTTGSTLKAALTPDPGASTVMGQLQPGVALFDTSGLGAYVSGGVITPNPRNITSTIHDYPDTYPITIVIPPQQDVTITVTWGTSSPNFVADAAVAQAVAPAIVDYVNKILVGGPINVLDLEDAFQAGVQGILPSDAITVLDFAVSINGIGTPVTMGTKIVEGDPQSFFFAEVSGIGFVRV
jgi:hypothetical protein